MTSREKNNRYSTKRKTVALGCVLFMVGLFAFAGGALGQNLTVLDATIDTEPPCVETDGSFDLTVTGTGPWHWRATRIYAGDPDSGGTEIECYQGPNTNVYPPEGLVENITVDLSTASNPPSAGVYDIYIVMTNLWNPCTDGSESDPYNAGPINIGSPPSVAPAAQPDVVCYGDDFYLYANPSGGTSPYTFQWSGPNGFSSIDEDPMISDVGPNEDGTYTVVVTDDNGCTGSDSVSVTTEPCVFTLTAHVEGTPGSVFAAPDMLGDGINCPGDCVGTYKAGAEVMLYAMPMGNSAFDVWYNVTCPIGVEAVYDEGDEPNFFLEKQETPITVLMDDDCEITAVFDIYYIPTLSQWGMIIAVLMVAGIAVVTIRRRRRTA